MKILVLTSHFLPHPSANGIITEHIVDELKHRGHEVICIGVKRGNESAYEVIKDIPIYRLPPAHYSLILQKAADAKRNNINDIYFKIHYILRKLKLIMMMLDFPNHDPKESREIYELVNALHGQNNFDCVIGIHKPYSNIAALVNFKRKNPHIFCAAYYLDLIDSHQKPQYLPLPIYQKLCYRSNMKTLKVLDFLLIPKSGRDIYGGSEYDRFRNKIEYVDFPTFLKPIRFEKHGKYTNSVVITFAGTLDRDYRNPDMILRILESASKIVGKIRFDVYGTGNCDDIFNQYRNLKNLEIVRHGVVNHDEVVEAMFRSDFLVNISNKIQNAVPSKIFELFSTGKPIVNLVFDKNDISLGYLQKYPAVHSIEAWRSLDLQVDDLCRFIESQREADYEISLIRKDFEENTPEFTVNIIEKRLSGINSPTN